MKKIPTIVWVLVIGVVFGVSAWFTIGAYSQSRKDPPPPPVAESVTPTPAQSPSTAGPTPTVENTAPPAGSETPTAESETPSVTGEPPMVETAAPSVTDTTPPVESETPPPAESEEPGGEFTVVGPIALVYQWGYLVDAVDLGRVTESYTTTYPGLDDAENSVEFAYGQARMDHSTCPDQVCVGMGWQDGSFPLPIACLPNSVIVEIVPANELFAPEVDGVTQ